MIGNGYLTSNAMVATARRLRENIRFAAGLAGLLHETVIAHADRPVLLGVFAAMIGVDIIRGKE